MKNQVRSVLLFIAISTLILSCGEEEAPPIPLQANAGEDQTASLDAIVTLDGSKSTGEPGFLLAWILSGSPNGVTEQNISLTNPNSTNPTFIPPKNGTYAFTLRAMRDGLVSEDQVFITVSGVLTLPATISTSTTLRDIEQDPAKPDYRATGLVTIPSGSTLSVPTTGASLTIEFAESAGLVVDGGTVQFTNAQVTLTSTNGWKGILVKSGNADLGSSTKIEKAGKSTFDGQTETASIVHTSGSIKVQGVTFTSSAGTYDLLLTGNQTEQINGQFSTTKPVKMPLQHVSKLVSTMPANHEYVVLTTPGASTILTSNDGIAFNPSIRYYIDGDASVGSNVTVGGGTRIFMKAGAGFFQSAGTFSGGSGAVMEGLGGASWKGLAFGFGSQASIGSLEIKKAGSEQFNTGSFTSDVKASIYFASGSNGTMSGAKITESQGYGVYQVQPNVYLAITGSTFTGTASAAISTDITVVHTAFSQHDVSPNTYTMSGSLPAVEVRSTNPNVNQPTGTWRALGGTNFYLIKGNVTKSSPWTLSPGVRLKFQTANSLKLTEQLFTAIGTANQPIVIDSEAGTPGTWGGILIESTYKIEFCQILNGGGSFLSSNGVTPASEKANVVFNNSTNAINSFKDNTISGSGGWGLLVEVGKQNPNAAATNTFSNNVSGNVIIK